MSQYLEESKEYKGFHYTELGEESLDYLHKRLVEMLRCVVDILSRNEIQYMICGGTLLGAMTTGHFIPWDDDVDMCIMERDYDRAIERLIAELPRDMVLQCNKTEKRYFHGWIKVRDKKSKTYPGEPIYQENGVWIDIYKLISMKENQIFLNKTLEHIKYLKRRYRAGGITRDEYWERVKKAGLSWKIVMSKMVSLFGFQRKNVYVLKSASGITLNARWCLPVRRYSFEGIDVTGFKEGEKYLVAHYGENYTELPGKEMRRVSINKVELIKGI